MTQKTVSNVLSKNEHLLKITEDEPAPELEPSPENAESRVEEEEPEEAEPDGPDKLAPPIPPSPPEPLQLPSEIIESARAVIGGYRETRPEGYVAKLMASDSEWMTITDDSLSNDLERDLLQGAAAMCLWQELMIWYHGENASSFTDTFGKIGDVFVRGQAGQWSLVAIATSKLRELIRRFRPVSAS